MAVFSFSPTNPADILCHRASFLVFPILNPDANDRLHLQTPIITRDRCVPDFAEKLTDFVNHGHTLLSASIGCDGDWFVRTDQSL